MARASQQTTRIAGKRVVIRTSAKGKVSVKDALPEEWELQAAQIRALKAHPDYGKRFLTAGDQNASKRGAKAQVQAIAAGMEAGEADVRIYLPRGRVGLIENKVGKAGLTKSQQRRHPILEAIGHRVEVVRAVTEEDAAAQAVALVEKWLEECDGA